jgi:hypothetical protein
MEVLGRAGDQRRDHVVRLQIGHLDQRNPVRIDQLAHHRDLGREILGCGIPAGLVGGIQTVAEGAAVRVVSHRDVVRALLADHLGQHVDEAVGGVGGGAVRRAQVGNREEGAEDRVRSIDHHELARGRGLGCHGSRRLAAHRRTRAVARHASFARALRCETYL